MSKQVSGTSHSTGIARRRLLKGALAAAALVGTGVAPSIIRAREGDTLIVNAYGGEFEQIYVDNVIKPFEKKMGVKVIYDGTGTASKTYAKIRASKGAPGFDVAAELTPEEILLGGKEGVLERITEENVPNLKYGWKRNRQIVEYFFQ